MQRPDVVRPASPMTEIEDRLGIPSVESLLAERDTLVTKAKRLWARHGPGGTYDDERKILLAQVAERIRTQALPERYTEAAVSDKAHAHDDYLKWVIACVQERADFFELSNQITGITDTVLRGNTISRYLAAEAMLAR